MEEKILVERCWAGDIEAFTALVEKYNAMAVRTAYLLTGCRDNAEDMAQEAFIQCFYSLGKLKDAGRFKSWFYKILVRTSWKMAKKQRSKFSGSVSSFEISGEISDGRDFTEDVEFKQMYDAVYKAIEELSKPLKAAAVLFYFGGFSVRETAEILGCREGTVKSRLFKVRRMVEDKLREQDWDGFYSTDGNRKGRESDLSV